MLAGRDAELRRSAERLKLTEAVLLEAMRLYPPVWSVGREALVDVEIGGYRLPKGSTFFISQWVMHRDPALFADPERFLPERWAATLCAACRASPTSPSAAARASASATASR